MCRWSIWHPNFVLNLSCFYGTPPTHNDRWWPYNPHPRLWTDFQCLWRWLRPLKCFSILQVLLCFGCTEGFWKILIDKSWSQGSNGEEDPADEQLLVDEWVGGGGGDRALRRFQGGSASNKWQVGQKGTKAFRIRKQFSQIIPRLILPKRGKRKYCLIVFVRKRRSPIEIQSGATWVKLIAKRKEGEN